MAAELTHTPVHQETGLALPIFVTPEDFLTKKDRQHHVEHPRRRLELQDYAGKALRCSRTQQLPNQLHMGLYPGSYHDIFWGPEIVPTDGQGKITKALLYIAQVIPREAIVLKGDEYEIKKGLTNKEHAFLSDPRLTHIEGNSYRSRQFQQHQIGSAIVRYALNQNLENIDSQKVRKDFLRTVDRQREAELGNLMIRSAIEESIKPALAIYEEAKTEGMVDPRRLDLRTIVRNFVPASDFGNYYEILRARLSPPETATPGEIIGQESLQTEVGKVELAA